MTSLPTLPLRSVNPPKGRRNLQAADGGSRDESIDVLRGGLSMSASGIDPMILATGADGFGGGASRALQNADFTEQSNAPTVPLIPQ